MRVALQIANCLNINHSTRNKFSFVHQGFMSTASRRHSSVRLACILFPDTRCRYCQLFKVVCVSVCIITVNTTIQYLVLQGNRECIIIEYGHTLINMMNT